MTYQEAIKFLYDLRWFGAVLGLENTRKLASLVGNPHDKLRFIHVAGTNGKGSTCAMLESIYRASGLRVGLFISPHLVSFRERIQVNRQLISKADVVRLVAELRGKMERRSPDRRDTNQHQRAEPEFGVPSDKRDSGPTFFEFVTVMALRHFAEQKCDLVIWETGLGGRLDATNIVTPLVSVITNVQFDHQQWLGDTLGKIAAEKAGIIKPGVPVVTATDEPEAFSVIEQTAGHFGAPLTRVTSDHASRITHHASLPLLGEHQRLNATLALATVEALQNKIPVSDAAIHTGLETVQWPGRLQLVTRAGGQQILLDGAHNVAGVQALQSALTKYFQAQKKSLILGVLQDKDWRHICEMLAPLAGRIVTVTVSSERSADAHELAAACRAANPSAEVSTCDSAADALRKTESDPFVVVTGSLYLVGEAIELLGLSPESSADERALNEWGGTPQATAYRKI